MLYFLLHDQLHFTIDGCLLLTLMLRLLLWHDDLHCLVMLGVLLWRVLGHEHNVLLMRE